MQNAKLLSFVSGMLQVVSQESDEGRLLPQGRDLLATLVAEDDWLDEAYARPHPEFYQQYLLYADPLDRLSVVSFVWGPGQKTPVHDHLTWGIIGMLRGREREITYEHAADGSLFAVGESILCPGETAVVSPTLGDVHQVSNDLEDEVSISIHVYGRNIGRVERHVFDPATGAPKTFVSGYANELTPNLWR